MKMTISMLLVASMMTPQLMGAERLSAKVDHDLPKKISEAALSAKEEGNHAASLRQLRQLLELYPNDGIIRAPIYAAMAEEAERAGDAAAAQQYKEIARELDAEVEKRAKEAMATGTPVAAYPVDGPLEVLCKAGGADDGVHHGGVLHADLQQACYQALAVPRHEARLRALDFSWSQAAQLFEGFLVSAQPHKANIKGSVGAVVTPLSSNL